jgi:hypothetical protein
MIDKQRPGQGSFFNVTAGKEVIFKRNHGDFYVSSDEFHLVFTQLRDVRPARQSAKVAVKYQQEPTSCVVLETMALAFAVLNHERYGWLARQVVHSCFSSK